MSPTLWLSSLRYMLRHPWQLGLSVLGIALGVAVVVAIDLANDSATRAFTLSTETVAGKATHQVVGGPTGLPEEVYRALRVELGVRPSAPVVEGDVASPAYPGRVFHLLGIDPFAEGPFRPYLGMASTAGGDLCALLSQSGTALMSSLTAAELGLAPGDDLPARVGSVEQSVHLIGTIEPENETSARAIDNLVVLDLASAQEVLGMAGRLSRIDLILPEGAEGEATIARLTESLPAGAEVVRAASRTEALAQMTSAFRLNLSALSLLALIVGAFLIYNTVTFSVVQRRPLLGTLRALGVSRREVLALVLGEAFLVALAGTALGLLLGIVLGQGLVRMVTQTINDLYFVLSVSELSLSPWPMLKATLLGLGITLLAALAPAVEATNVPPRAVLSRSLLEGRARERAPRLAALGVLALLAGAALLALPSRELVPSFASLFAIVLGSALLTPFAVARLMGTLQAPAGRAFGVLGRMAARGVVAALSRTSVAIAALMVAVSVTVGVGVMVDSFRHTVVSWLESSLQADVYVSAPNLVGNRSDTLLDPALAERLATVPGVAGMGTYRRVVVESPQGPTQLVALKIDSPGEGRAAPTDAFRFKEGNTATVWPAFQEGQGVLVSEPYAYHHNIAVGDEVQLRTDRGMQAFPVIGIYYDYGSDQGLVMMGRRTYETYFEDRGISSLGIYAAPGVDVDELVTRLRERAGTEQTVLIRSNRALREASIEIFDRTFAITTVLRLLAVLVAFIGVLSALMALQLERAREVGVLRANGLTPRQVLGLTTSQTGLMGLAAGLLSLPLGLALAWVLIYVINRRSFGWTLQMQVGADVLIQAVLLALLAAVLAGLYPAFKMARVAPSLALREE